MPCRSDACSGVAGLSLCSAHTLREYLGVAPGALSPLALINDGARAVELIIDDSLRNVSRMLFHPPLNTSTVALARDDSHRFLGVVGREPRYIAVGPA